MITPSGGTGIAINLTPVPTSNVDLWNAGTENAKKALGLIQDSLKTVDVSFVKHRPYTYDNRNPSDPALSHPIHTTRLAAKSEGSSEEEWQQRYEALLKAFPKELQAWFNVQTQIAYKQRAPEYYALHALLVLTADTLVWLDRMEKPLEPNSAEFERAEQNLLVPYIAVSGVILQGKEVVQYGLKLLGEIGPNHPHYDKLTHYFLQTEKHLQMLENVLIDLAKDQPPSDAHDRLNTLTHAIKLLKDQYHHTNIGKELRILGSMIDSLSIATSALTLGYGPASVLWMFALSENDTSMTIRALSDKISEGLISTSIEGKKEFLSSAIQMLLAIGAATAKGIAENGALFLPKIDPQTDDLVHITLLDYIIHLLIDAEVLSNITNHLAQSLTAIEKKQNFLSDSVQLTILAMLPFVIDKEENAMKIFDSLNENLTGLINRIASQIGDVPKTRSLAMYLQQAKIALENRDFIGFQDACKGLLEAYQILPKSLKEDFEKSYNLGTLMMQAIKKSPEDPMNRLTAIQSA